MIFSFHSPRLLIMGGERSSTTRRRMSGKICCACGSSLPPPHSPGEKYCTRCQTERKPVHRVLMHFMLRVGWRCQFLEEDLKTPLPRELTFRGPAKLFELAVRGGCLMNLEDRQAIEHGIEIGRGSIWLRLTAEQYSKLAGR
jgi:hypothetical protein